MRGVPFFLPSSFFFSLGLTGGSGCLFPLFPSFLGEHQPTRVRGGFCTKILTGSTFLPSFPSLPLPSQDALVRHRAVPPFPFFFFFFPLLQDGIGSAVLRLFTLGRVIADGTPHFPFFPRGKHGSNLGVFLLPFFFFFARKAEKAWEADFALKGRVPSRFFFFLFLSGSAGILSPPLFPFLFEDDGGPMGPPVWAEGRERLFFLLPFSLLFSFNRICVTSIFPSFFFFPHSAAATGPTRTCMGKPDRNGSPLPPLPFFFPRDWVNSHLLLFFFFSQIADARVCCCSS